MVSCRHLRSLPLFFVCLHADLIIISIRLLQRHKAQKGEKYMSNPNGITASRIKSLRIEKGESQLQFCEHLSELMGKTERIAPMTVSNWETGRKAPTFETIIWLQRYFGVSIDYIAGLTDNRTIGANVNDPSNASKPEQGVEIAYRDLPKHDGDPVYVVFPSSNYKNQWGIVDFVNKRIIFLPLI